MNSAETLIKTKEKLEEVGWCQYQMESADGRMCLIGAYGDSVGKIWPGNVVATMGWYLLMHAIGSNDVVSWNDWPGRTVEEVMAALDLAIVLDGARCM